MTVNDNADKYIDRAVRLRAALQQIADMDPKGERADDLGRAARVARDALAADGVQGLLTPCKHCGATQGEEHSVTCPHGVPASRPETFPPHPPMPEKDAPK